MQTVLALAILVILSREDGEGPHTFQRHASVIV